MKNDIEFDEDEYYSDLVQNSLYEVCPNCNTTYDEIDYEYQFCHICNYDPENEKL